MASTPGFEPGSHWWEASTLITAPSLVFKVLNLKPWLNTASTPTIFFWFYIFFALGGEYNVTIQESEPMRLLETLRSLSEYDILIRDVILSTSLPQLAQKGFNNSLTA